MIEIKIRVGKGKHEWRDQTHRLDNRKNIYFGAFSYRIFGEVFTERGIEFDEAFDKYLTWRALNGTATIPK